jgi:hypothetical protein
MISMLYLFHQKAITSTLRAWPTFYLLPRADNGSGHIVFKLNTKQPVSVNRVDTIPTTEAIIDTVNGIAEQEGQPEGIEFSDMNGGITLQDFADNDINNDSNASDDDFVLDKEYEDEEKTEIALKEEDGIVGNDDPESKDDYFQTPIQQHNTEVSNNNELTSAVVRRSKRVVTQTPIVALNNAIVPENQECDKRKKKNSEDDEPVLIDEDIDEDIPPTADEAKVAPNSVDCEEDDNNGIDNGTSMTKELDSDLVPYWTLAQSSQAYVLNTIGTYNNIEASKSTPQYGFNRGLKEFGALGYEATVKELENNLLGMGAVKMLKPSELSKTTRYEALNYLMFLKRKRCGKIKARGCADGRPQREYISKDESSSPTVSIYALMTSCLMDAIEG